MKRKALSLLLIPAFMGLGFLAFIVPTWTAGQFLGVIGVVLVLLAWVLIVVKWGGYNAAHPKAGR